MHSELCYFKDLRFYAYAPITLSRAANKRADAIAHAETRRIVDAKNGPFTLRPHDGQGACALRNESGVN